MTFATNHRLNTLYGTPDYVKEASAQDEDLNKLPRNVFADPAQRRFPCHTKAACYKSNAAFWEEAILNDKEDPNIGKYLLKMAEYWKIEHDVRTNILEKVAKQPVLDSIGELDDSSFAVIREHPETGESLRLYPIVDEDTVKLAALQLFQDKHLLPLDWRRDAAIAILTKAADFNMDIEDETLEDYLQRAAGRGVSSMERMVKSMQKRALLLKVRDMPEEAAQLTKAAEVISRQKLTRQLAIKVAEVLDKVDQSAKLYTEYLNGLGLPEEDCHHILYKHAVAALDEYIKTASGSVYEKKELARIDSGSFEALLGKQASSGITLMDQSIDIEKVASAVEKMSPSQAALFDRAMTMSGVKTAEVPIDLDLFK